MFKKFLSKRLILIVILGLLILFVIYRPNSVDKKPQEESTAKHVNYQFSKEVDSSRTDWTRYNVFGIYQVSFPSDWKVDEMKNFSSLQATKGDRNDMKKRISATVSFNEVSSNAFVLDEFNQEYGFTSDGLTETLNAVQKIENLSVDGKKAFKKYIDTTGHTSPANFGFVYSIDDEDKVIYQIQFSTLDKQLLLANVKAFDEVVKSMKFLE